MTAKPRVFVSQPIAPSALERLRTIADVKINADSSKIIAKSQADRGGEEMRHPVFAAA